MDLSPEDLLNSHLPSPELFDSRVEESFAQRWGPQREGWSLEREAEILCEGQKVFVPDFLLRHADGRKVLLEIVGFWTPEYLAAKFQTLRTFKRHSILLALGKSASARKADLPPGAIHYKTVLRPQDVLQHLRARK